MKIAENTTEVTGNLQIAEEVRMNIDASASALVIRHLTNLYAKPALAVLREYSSNAYDSHIMAKQTRPVEIGLPNRLNPNLVVEDFGVGLSRDGLRAYGQYGLSSKTSNNDEIGGFGLGSKSGLAVSSQFTVQAIKDGLKNTAVIGFDTSGHPVMRFLNEEPVETDEPSGLKITIPTSADNSRYQEALENNMFLGWPVGSIRLNGAAPELSVHDPDKYTPVGEWGWIRSDYSYTNARYNYGNYAGTALVGPVKYAIQWDQVEVPNILVGSFFRQAVLNVPIGSVDLVPSREELRYTMRTKKALNEIIANMISEAKKSFQEQIDNEPDLRHALIRVIEINNQGFGRDFTYQGKSLTLEQRIETDLDTVVTISRVDQNQRYVNGSYRDYYYADNSTTNWSWANEFLDKIVRNAAVLVVNAGETVYKGRKGYEELVHANVSYIVAYDRSLGDDENSTYSLGTNRYFFTSLDRSELPSLMVEAFNSVIEFSDIVPVADAFRAKKAKEARANRGPVVKKAVTETKVRVLNYRSNGRSREVEKTLGDLDSTQKWVILQSNKAEDLSHQARRAATTLVGYDEYRFLSQTIALLEQHGYGFLCANLSWKTDKYSQVLPNIVSLQDAVTDVLDTLVNSVTPTQLQAAQDMDTARHSFAWVSSVPDNLIDTVDNLETREWIRAMKKNNISDVLSSIKLIIQRSTEFGIDNTKYSLPQGGTTASPGLHYPLLSDLYSTRRGQELVDYINWIDSRDATAV